MALVKMLDEYDLQNEFRRYDRDYFSLEGYRTILELFEETDCGTNTDLDVIGICCDFTEAEPEDIINNYNHFEDIAECMNEETEDIDTEALINALNYYTWAVELSNGCILYQNF